MNAARSATVADATQTSLQRNAMTVVDAIGVLRTSTSMLDPNFVSPDYGQTHLAAARMFALRAAVRTLKAVSPDLMVGLAAGAAAKGDPALAVLLWGVIGLAGDVVESPFQLVRAAIDLYASTGQATLGGAVDALLAAQNSLNYGDRFTDYWRD